MYWIPKISNIFWAKVNTAPLGPQQGPLGGYWTPGNNVSTRVLT